MSVLDIDLAHWPDDELQELVTGCDAPSAKAILRAAKQLQETMDEKMRANPRANPENMRDGVPYQLGYCRAMEDILSLPKAAARSWKVRGERETGR